MGKGMRYVAGVAVGAAAGAVLVVMTVAPEAPLDPVQA